MRRTWIALGSCLLVLIGAGFMVPRFNAIAVRMLIDTGQRGDPPRSPVPPGVRQRLWVARTDATLRAWVLDPVDAGSVRGTIVVLHGIRDSKLGVLASARAQVQRGYRAVVYDARGHGESTGRYLTYGVREAEDLRAIVDRLTQLGMFVPPLYVIGTSYGAATALLHAAADPRVEKLVAIAPFASLREVVPAYLHWTLGPLARVIPARWVNERIDEAARVAGFDADSACPRCAAASIRAPVLLVASRDDERIPFVQAQAIHAALPQPAGFIALTGVAHVDVGSAPGVDAAIAEFLDAARR